MNWSDLNLLNQFLLEMQKNECSLVEFEKLGIRLASIHVDFFKENEEAFFAFLSSKEKTYALNYLRSINRKEFCMGRIVLKLLVLECYGWDLNEINRLEFVRGPLGEPVLFRDGHKDDFPKLSLSHKDGWVFAGISTQSPFGVDIELISDRLIDISRQFTTKYEIELTQNQSIGNDDIELFLAKIWTAKESVVKSKKTTFESVLTNVELVSYCDNSFDFVDHKSGEIFRADFQRNEDYLYCVVKEKGDSHEQFSGR